MTSNEQFEKEIQDLNDILEHILNDIEYWKSVISRYPLSDMFWDARGFNQKLRDRLQSRLEVLKPNFPDNQP